MSAEPKGLLARIAAPTLAALAFLAICVATLTPSGGVTTLDFWCIACGEFGGVDVVANIVMFLPLGFALALATNRPRLTFALCVATTLMVELLQISIVPGRDASLNDLLANALGGLLGVVVAANWQTLVRPDPRPGSRLTVSWAALVAVVLIGTSWGLRPSFIPISLWIQRVPDRQSYEPFTGKLLSFDVDGINLPDPFPGRALRVFDHLARDTWTATAVVDTRGLRPTRSIVVRVSEEFTSLVWIDQIGWNVTCLQKTRSGDFRFRSPRASLTDALRPADAQHSTAKLRCSRRHGALHVDVEQGGRTKAYDMALTPSLGWALLSPFSIEFDDRYRVASALWLAALVFPLGYWWSSARVARRPSAERRPIRALGGLASLAVVVALVGGLVLAPRAFAIATASWWEWAVTAGALATGVLAHRFVQHRRPAHVR